MVISSADDQSVAFAESALNEVIEETKQKEKKQLALAIHQLDEDVKKTKELLSRLKTQVQNEIAAATEECQKMSFAAAQCGGKMSKQ